MQDVIDMAVVQELVDLSDDGDPELLLDLVAMFLDDAPARVQTILSAAAAADLEEVERAAHSLKGSAGNLGATYLQEIAEQLQLAGRSKDKPAVDGLMESLQERSEEAQTALRTIAARYSA